MLDCRDGAVRFSGDKILVVRVSALAVVDHDNRSATAGLAPAPCAGVGAGTRHRLPLRPRQEADSPTACVERAVTLLFLFYGRDEGFEVVPRLGSLQPGGVRAAGRARALIMSNKITVVAGARTVQARLHGWGDVSDVDGMPELYWRAHRWNGHVRISDEHITWLRGWNHGKKTRDALVVAAALGRAD